MARPNQMDPWNEQMNGPKEKPWWHVEDLYFDPDGRLHIRNPRLESAIRKAVEQSVGIQIQSDLAGTAGQEIAMIKPPINARCESGAS